MEKRVVPASISSLLQREQGSVLVEAVVVVPAFIFLLFASIQLFVISWRLSQVQLQSSVLARQLAIPNDKDNEYPCAQVSADAKTFGLAELGVDEVAPVTIQVMTQNVSGAYEPVAPAGGCPAANFDNTPDTVVLTLTYQAPLFFGQLIPGGAFFTYRGVAVAVLERPQGGD